ncbi:MAG: hypothetical protein DHS20C05_24910 [Hyphococcus sp.]|nr:MAG: hypothetical protein DHS20C05_24910 [Marinicaulis sp.]
MIALGEWVKISLASTVIATGVGGLFTSCTNSHIADLENRINEINVASVYVDLATDQDKPAHYRSSALTALLATEVVKPEIVFQMAYKNQSDVDDFVMRDLYYQYAKLDVENLTIPIGNVSKKYLDAKDPSTIVVDGWAADADKITVLQLIIDGEIKCNLVRSDVEPETDLITSDCGEYGFDDRHQHYLEYMPEKKIRNRKKIGFEMRAILGSEASASLRQVGCTQIRVQARNSKGQYSEILNSSVQLYGDKFAVMGFGRKPCDDLLASKSSEAVQ